MAANKVHKVGTNGSAVGNITLYTNVITIGGQQIDCIVTSVSLTGGTFTLPGKAPFLLIILLQQANNASLLQVYPNPASQAIQLNTNLSSGTLKVYNMQGNVVMQQSWKRGESVAIARLAAGTYVVELQSTNAVVKERFVKQ